MTDILFNTMLNDIALTGNDFRMIDYCADQNSALILTHTAVSILYPEVGVGLDEKFEHLRNSDLEPLLNRAENQIRDDGAISVQITKEFLTPDDLTIGVKANYGELNELRS